jgi:LPXTG-motif cell wall-anchored protein
MKMKSFVTTAGAAALALSMWIASGILQGQPLYDRIQVNIPYKITLGDKTLQPGDYTIQQLPDNGGGSRVLLFYTDSGMKFETSAMTIPALDINTARDTKLVLGHVGEDYYINKIWVQGKEYGYELPVPPRLKERLNERTETTVAAQYQLAPSTQAQPTQPAPAAPPPVTSQTEARPEPQPPAQSTEATHPVEPPPPTTADRSAEEAQAQTPPPAPAPTEMPKTAANWMMMLLSGGALSGAGLLLRRKR